MQRHDLPFSDEIEPVCTPADLKLHGGMRRREKLLAGPLLVSRCRRDDWDAGQLVRPCAQPLRRDSRHDLVQPAVQRESRKVTAFRESILTAVASG